MRHTGGAADQHDAVNVIGGKVCIAQGGAHAGERFFQQQRGHLKERGARKRQINRFAAIEGERDVGGFILCERLFRGARGAHHAGDVGGAGRVDAGLFQHPAVNAVVKIVAAQGAVAMRGDDFKEAARKPQDGQVKRAAAQVVNGKDAFGGAVQPVGECGGGGFVQEAQNVNAGKPRGVFGSLPLGIVKIRRYGDDRADKVFT